MNDRVPAQADVGVDIGGPRIDDGHTLEHPAPPYPLAHGGLGIGQADAVVDPQRLARVGDGDRRGWPPGVVGQGDEVGEIQLAPFAGAELFQRGPEPRRLEAIGANVDLVDVSRLLRQLRLLDDGLDPATVVSDHPAGDANGPRGAREHGHDRPCFQVAGREGGQTLRADEGEIAVGDQHVLGRVLKGAPGQGQGVTGAQLLWLFDVGKALTQYGPDLGGALPDHDGCPSDAGLGDRPGDVGPHGTAADPVHHLGPLGLHAGPETRRQHHGHPVVHVRLSGIK